ncbi:MAG: U32 family peptidase, partial [Muribaculaceae bacterium]|nr:U32 family peptidase [Muribaculaceae bacterium]
MMKRSDFEIMAPVGSYDSLAAAIDAGADAVYFGVEGLNMRSRSSANFTLEDLARIVGICRDKGVKTYLTVNTIVYDEDMERVDSVVAAAAAAGVSAV